MAEAWERVGISPSDLIQLWDLCDGHDPPIPRENLRLRWALLPSPHWEARDSADDTIIACMCCSTGAWTAGAHE